MTAKTQQNNQVPQSELQQVDIQDVLMFYKDEVSRHISEKVILKATVKKLQDEIRQLKSK